MRLLVFVGILVVVHGAPVELEVAEVAAPAAPIVDPAVEVPAAPIVDPAEEVPAAPIVDPAEEVPAAPIVDPAEEVPAAFDDILEVAVPAADIPEDAPAADPVVIAPAEVPASETPAGPADIAPPPHEPLITVDPSDVISSEEALFWMFAVFADPDLLEEMAADDVPPPAAPAAAHAAAAPSFTPAPPKPLLNLEGSAVFMQFAD